MTALLAQIDPRLVWHEQFNKPAWDARTWAEILLVLLGLVAGALVLIVVQRMQLRKNGQLRSQTELFREVLVGLELSTAQQRLLRRVARDLQMTMPSRMLLSADFFSEAVRTWLEGRGARARAVHKHRLRDVREKLFGAQPASH